MVAASFDALEIGDAMGAVVEDEDGSMCSLVVWVAVGWCAKGLAAAYLKVLAHGGVLLLVQVCFQQYGKFVVSTPQPVENLLGKRGHVCTVEPHGGLCISCLLRWCLILSRVEEGQSPGFQVPAKLWLSA